MSKTKFQDVSPEEGRLRLESLSFSTEDIVVQRQYDPGEVAQMQKEHVDLSLEISDVEASKKDAVADYNATLKALRAQQEAILTNLRYGHESGKQKAWAFPNPETRMTEFYDSAGRLVMERPCTGLESNWNPIRTLKTGTDE